ncbi:MAG: hypothetical protein JAZ06_14615 [Candidatus Thiodiazotropha taylori]|nr:hypothetical protein [Candidatus Thiodiazotropha taylori]
MKKIALLILIPLLAGCGAVDSMTEGFKHTQEVASDIGNSVGSKPFVGFSWHNGSLTNVNVTFNGVPKEKTVEELIELSRNSIHKYFKQSPDHITVAFSVDGGL